MWLDLGNVHSLHIPCIVELLFIYHFCKFQVCLPFPVDFIDLQMRKIGYVNYTHFVKSSRKYQCNLIRWSNIPLEQSAFCIIPCQLSNADIEPCMWGIEDYDSLYFHHKNMHVNQHKLISPIGYSYLVTYSGHSIWIYRF